MTKRSNGAVVFATIAMFALFPALALAQKSNAKPSADAALENILKRFPRSEPGCAIGIEHGPRQLILRAAGSANLEQNVPIGVDTVFEAGSASKQFTAAAVLLLANDRKLSLDDDVRKYVPELPLYSSAITIRHLLNHTSGLRDWGSLQEIAGWPRGETAYGMAEILRILSKQKSLNYEPGTAYSYTNSGYNLLEFIVERVSGKSLQQFNKEKIFGPLGMNHTQWREDFRTVVPRRAIAYAKTGQTYTQRMPFENVTGSGGLLTTVGDLLRWNRALEKGKLGATFASQMQQTGVLKSGKAITYALGLNVVTYRGASHIYHEGLTAGYHAWLSRFPNRSLSISILCNSQNIETFPLAHEIADIFLNDRKPETKFLSRDEMTKLEGLYVSRRSGMPLSLVQHNGSLFINTNGSASPGAAPPLTKNPQGGLVSGKMNFEIVGDGLLRQAAAGDWIDFDKLPAGSSSSPDTRGVPGRYSSKELDATFIVTETPKCLSMAIEDRPSRTGCLTPVYEGAFLFRSTLVRPVRTPAGSVRGLRFSNERVWDLRAEKID